MKSKITFLKLASLLLIDNKISEFNIPYLVKFMTFLTLKITDRYPLFDSLRDTINMGFIPIKSEKLTIAHRTSICMAANRGEFNY